MAVIKDLKDLLVSSACCRLYVGQEPCSCEQVDVGILWGTQRGAQTDWGDRWGRGYTDREIKKNNNMGNIYYLRKVRISNHVEKHQATIDGQQCRNRRLSGRNVFTSGHHG